MTTMKRNIFVCHRPYHILRCCDMITSNKKMECENILFTYDVKLVKSSEYQKFDIYDVFYSYFDHVIELQRYDNPSVRSIMKLYAYCKKRRGEYLSYVNKYKDADTLYFFADNELEIQLLVGLFREKGKTELNCILVDEGLVTYSPTSHAPSWKRRLWLRMFKFMAGIKYFNIELTYGTSNIYNRAMANVPEKAVYFRKPIDFLPPLSGAICEEIRNKIKSSHIPNYKNPYFIYVGTYEKPFQDELPVITQIRILLKKHGVDFYIKLHPQQNETLYAEHFGSEVLLEKGLPIELFFGQKTVMGGTISSSLFNASIQGYQALDISKLFPEDQRRNWSHKSITDKYKWINVHPISSYEQFELYIVNFVKSIE